MMRTDGAQEIRYCLIVAQVPVSMEFQHGEFARHHAEGRP